MKKFALVLFAGLSLATANAQVQFGVKAGANFATLSGDAADGAKTQVGFNAGLLVKLPLAGALSLQPEVVYSGQGAKYSEGGEDGNLHLNYINVPVLVKYSLPMGVFFQTGPQIGFLMSAKAKFDGNSEDLKDDYKSTDFSWVFGAGYLSSANIGIEARYGLGLSKLGKGDDAGSLKNGVFSVGLFYMFGASSKK